MTSIFLSINHSHKHSFQIHFVPCHGSLPINRIEGDRGLQDVPDGFQCTGDVAKGVQIRGEPWFETESLDSLISLGFNIQSEAQEEAASWRMEGDCLAAVMACLVNPQYWEDAERTSLRKDGKKQFLNLH